jgi:hypothetical protein
VDQVGGSCVVSMVLCGAIVIASPSDSASTTWRDGRSQTSHLLPTMKKGAIMARPQSLDARQ